MSRIYVEYSKLEELGKGCEPASSKLSAIREDFQNLIVLLVLQKKINLRLSQKKSE